MSIFKGDKMTWYGALIGAILMSGVTIFFSVLFVSEYKNLDEYIWQAVLRSAGMLVIGAFCGFAVAKWLKYIKKFSYGMRTFLVGGTGVFLIGFILVLYVGFAMGGPLNILGLLLFLFPIVVLIVMPVLFLVFLFHSFSKK